MATPFNDSKVVIKFLKKNIFARFGTPRVLLSDNGTHFYNKPLECLLKKCGVCYKLTGSYHPKTSGQVEPGVEEHFGEDSRLVPRGLAFEAR